MTIIYIEAIKALIAIKVLIIDGVSAVTFNINFAFKPYAALTDNDRNDDNIFPATATVTTARPEDMSRRKAFKEVLQESFEAS